MATMESLKLYLFIALSFIILNNCCCSVFNGEIDSATACIKVDDYRVSLITNRLAEEFPDSNIELMNVQYLTDTFMINNSYKDSLSYSKLLIKMDSVLNYFEEKILENSTLKNCVQYPVVVNTYNRLRNFRHKEYDSIHKASISLLGTNWGRNLDFSKNYYPFLECGFKKIDSVLLKEAWKLNLEFINGYGSFLNSKGIRVGWNTLNRYNAYILVRFKLNNSSQIKNVIFYEYSDDDEEIRDKSQVPKGDLILQSIW